MTPQVQTLLTHLQQHGSISQAEAGLVYRIRALPRRIADLKAEGYNIKRELKVDPMGQRYARYSLIVRPKVGDRVRVVTEGDLSSDGLYYHVGAEGVITKEYLNDFYVKFDKPTDAGDRFWYVGKDDIEVIA
jgi:hypothetical protein